MSSMLFDFLLIIIFFIAYKMYDIYVATIVAIVGAILQVIMTRLIHKRFDKKQLLVLAILIIFGGMTLYFHDPIFIKWKPTIVFWLLGIVFLGSQIIGKKPIIERLMSHVIEKHIHIPAIIWKRFNLAWGIFFLFLGTVNVFIAYYLSTDAWVNFKLYGILGALLLFGFLQSIFLAKYLNVK